MLRPFRPAFSPSTVILPNRETLAVRQVCKNDRKAIADMIYASSMETIYQRFMTTNREFVIRNLDLILQNRDSGSLSLVAAPALPEIEMVVALANLVIQEEGEAEAALLVADEFQKQGLGMMMAARLAEAARDLGVVVLTVHTFDANEAVKKMVRRLGLNPFCRSGNGMVEMKAILPKRPVDAGV